MSRYWWAFVVRGIFAILFGILAYAWPGITLATLIIFFGAYVLIDGILLVIKTIGNWGERDDRWLLLPYCSSRVSNFERSAHDPKAQRQNLKNRTIWIPFATSS